METAHDEIYKNRNITIVYDSEGAENPLEAWDMLGTFSCFHRRYILSTPDAVKDMDELKELIERPDVLALPLFLYDHSGLTISTSAFSCPWDSGQIGYIHISHEKIIKEYGDASPETLEKVKKYLWGEVETFDAYLTGQIYGYQVEEGGIGESEDSCYGYYGDDGFKQAIEEARHHIDWDIKQAKIKRLAAIDAARKIPAARALARLNQIHHRA